MATNLKTEKIIPLVLQFTKEKNKNNRFLLVTKFTEKNNPSKQQISNFLKQYEKYDLFEKVIEKFFQYGFDGIDWEEGHKCGIFCLKDYQTFPELKKYRKQEEYEFKKENLIYKMGDLREDIYNGQNLLLNTFSPSKIEKVTKQVVKMEKELKQLEKQLKRIK
jgi:hypothetical protein